MQEELKVGVETRVVGWPSPQDYCEAMQNPHASFLDKDLRYGKVELDRFGLPKPTSGMFASVYRLDTGSGIWAVRCFLQWKNDQVERYREIERTLAEASLPCMLNFEFQKDGLRIEQRSFPLLKMEWCSGESLNRWLQLNLRNKEALESFLEEWRNLMSTLRLHGIAHGDLQHGNVLIQNGQIRLVDYDGMYVPRFQGMASNELGHRNYQHPGRNEEHFGPYLDNFSAWLIYISVLISGCDPNVFHDFAGGDECLLFRRQDLENPLESELFYVLEHHSNPQIREASRTLRHILRLDPQDVPGLETSISIPADLPELNAIISDLPDWLRTSDTGDGELAIPEGKPLLKLTRKRGVPLPEEYKTGSISGRWIYDAEGLVFDPQIKRAPECSQDILDQNPPILHSPLLETFTVPAPYKQIGGQLHSPMLSPVSEKYEDSGNLASFSALRPLLKPGLGILAFLICLALCTWLPRLQTFEYNPPPPEDESAQSQSEQDKAEKPLPPWMNDLHSSLLRGASFEEDGDSEQAIDIYKQGLSDLAKSNDSRAPLSKAYLYFNLGRVENYLGKFNDSEIHLRLSLKQFQNLYNSSPDSAGVLAELGRAYENDGKLKEAKQSYKQAVSIMEQNGIDNNNQTMQDTLTRLVDLLKNEKNSAEAAKYTALLPEHLRAYYSENSSTDKKQKQDKYRIKPVSNNNARPGDPKKRLNKIRPF